MKISPAATAVTAATAANRVRKSGDVRSSSRFPVRGPGCGPDTSQNGVPATYLVDRDGRIAAWHVGEHDGDELATAIDSQLR